MTEMAKGNLVIIGGAEDKKGQCKILRYLVEISGGAKARPVIITTAAQYPEEAGAEYKDVFERLGAGSTRVLNLNTRAEANADGIEKIMEDASFIFFTGGDQLRITSMLGGTRFYDILHKLYRQGIIIAGTSAGASAMSGTMIIDGNDNEAARKCTLKMAPGIGLLEKTLIDQHFHERGRIGRLLSGVAENPQILGIGIDEDTAVRVFPDGHLEVIGSNAVTIVDGKNMISSNVSELKQDENLAIVGISMHILPCGYGFDMNSREVLYNGGRII